MKTQHPFERRCSAASLSHILLDHCFQQTLAVNLSRLLPSDSIYISDWPHNQVTLRVSIAEQQFDVDTHGHGTLIAQWQITAPKSDRPLKSGQTRLERTGASAHGKPDIIASQLSELTADFSRDLAQSIREAVKTIR